MAIVEDLFDFSDPQTLLALHEPGSYDVDPGSLLEEDAVDHINPGSVPHADVDGQPSKPRQTRNRTLWENDWEEKRDLITSLYKTMKLEDLMAEMKKRGFSAARSMYLRRIVQWKINKNFKASEKQAVIDLNQDSPLDPDSNTIFSIPSDRLARYERDRRRRSRRICRVESPHSHSPRLGPDQNLSFSSPRSSRDGFPLTRNYNGKHTNSIVMSGRFLYSPSEGPSELFLMQLREYIQVRFQFFASHCPSSLHDVESGTLYNIPESYQRLSNQLGLARDASIMREPAMIYKWLDKACGLARDVLQQAHWRLLNIFGDICWLSRYDPGIGKFIASFFADMAEAIHPNSQHCIVQLFRLFRQIIQQDCVVEIAGKIAMDSVLDMVPEHDEIQALMQSDVIKLYSISGLHDSAMQIAKKSRDFCCITFGSAHWHTRWVIYGLIRVYTGRKDFVDSYQEGVKLLRMYQEEHIPPDEVAIRACTILGDTCLSLGMLDSAIHYYQMHVNLLRPLYDGSGIIEDDEMYELEYSQRMVHNIKQRQLRASNPYGFIEDVAYSSSVPCSHADRSFEYWCGVHGW